MSYLRSILIPTVISALFTGCANNATACDTMITVNAPPNCVIEKFDDYYNNHYEYLWNYLNSTAELVQKCESLSDYADFLKLLSIKHENSEFFEFASETVEETLFEKPECLLDSLLLTDRKTQQGVLTLLNQPMVHEPEEVNEILEKYKNNDKYRPLWKSEN